MKPEVKKLILSNLPYLIFVYLFGKLGQAYRLAAGMDLSEKLLHFMDGCSAAFANAAPSFHPFDPVSYTHLFRILSREKWVEKSRSAIRGSLKDARGEPPVRPGGAAC